MENPNMSYIEAMSNGDKAFEEKIIKIIKTEFVVERKDYETLIKKKDFEKSAQMVHKIKHKISILSLEKSYAIAQHYEESLLIGKTELQLDFEAILDGIQDFLNRI